MKAELEPIDALNLQALVIATKYIDTVIDRDNNDDVQIDDIPPFVPSSNYQQLLLEAKALAAEDNLINVTNGFKVIDNILSAKNGYEYSY